MSDIFYRHEQRLALAVMMTWLRIEQLHHKMDDMTRGAELSVLLCRGNFREQILERIAHHVSRGVNGVYPWEERVDKINRLTQDRAFIQIKLEVGVAHAIADRFDAIS